jgi:hypothetical protein
VRTDCGGRFFAAILSIIGHDCPHQLFDQLLPDRAILVTLWFCNRLGNRVNDFICFSGIASASNLALSASQSENLFCVPAGNPANALIS